MDTELCAHTTAISAAQMHVLDLHRMLLSDHQGQQAFQQALRETIRGGQAVLDLGTGTGIHALFACQAGAKRVYAVDQHEVIELAREVCAANGYTDRISFLHTPAAQLDLPEPVDVIVTHLDLPGLLRFLPRVRDRVLKNTGLLVPSAVELFVAPLETPVVYEQAVKFWELRRHELSFRAVRSVAVNTMHDHRIDLKELLAEPARLVTFDLSRVKDPRLSATVETQIARPGVLHGLGIWYVEWLTKSIALSTAPGSALPFGPWRNGFLPVGVPTPLEPGETLGLRIRTGTGGWGEVWSWDVRIKDRQGKEKTRFVHSSFSARLISKEVLRKQAPDRTPRLPPLGAAAAFVLESCGGPKPLHRIEREVLERFPEVFASQGEAAGFVAELVTRYSI